MPWRLLIATSNHHFARKSSTKTANAFWVLCMAPSFSSSSDDDADIRWRFSSETEQISLQLEPPPKVNGELLIFMALDRCPEAVLIEVVSRCESSSNSRVSSWNSKLCIQSACDMDFLGLTPCHRMKIVYQSKFPKDIAIQLQHSQEWFGVICSATYPALYVFRGQQSCSFTKSLCTE